MKKTYNNVEIYKKNKMIIIRIEALVKVVVVKALKIKNMNLLQKEHLKDECHQVVQEATVKGVEAVAVEAEVLTIKKTMAKNISKNNSLMLD